MAVSIKNLREQLLDRIDKKSLVQMEKVERYIQLVQSFRKMNTAIRKEGESITVENGTQRFTKAHPLIAERNKINTALLSIERSFGFEETGPIKHDPSELV